MTTRIWFQIGHTLQFTTRATIAMLLSDSACFWRNFHLIINSLRREMEVTVRFLHSLPNHGWWSTLRNTTLSILTKHATRFGNTSQISSANTSTVPLYAEKKKEKNIVHGLNSNDWPSTWRNFKMFLVVESRASSSGPDAAFNVNGPDKIETQVVVWLVERPSGY